MTTKAALKSMSEAARCDSMKHLMKGETSKYKGILQQRNKNYEATYFMKKNKWLIYDWIPTSEHTTVITIFLIIVGSLICDIQWMQCVAKVVTPQLPLDLPQGARRTLWLGNAFKGRDAGVVTLSCKEDIVRSSGFINFSWATKISVAGLGLTGSTLAPKMNGNIYNNEFGWSWLEEVQHLRPQIWNWYSIWR